ncbi:hypothetical protein EYZ11_012164 [Aspergillus tanneri]|uniref:Uncharacterized protein n=1 Tax=Aspergillus tanneri TaxID=1220188 RepID=A0A4S3J323_9EURO|nr:hypothetical protein EYZ11_012164 [Aspergillus tanneri]
MVDNETKYSVGLVPKILEHHMRRINV